MPNRPTRAFTLALRNLGGANYCHACRRNGGHPGPGCTIAEEGEERRSCPMCSHPVDYEGFAIGRLIDGKVEPPGLLVMPRGDRARLLESVHRKGRGVQPSA